MATEARDFRTSSEEISYWKSLALDYNQRWQHIKEEFEEFQSSSHELESEYESQIKSLEKQKSELVRQLERIKNEHEDVTEKFSKHRQQTSKHINVVEMKLSKAEGIVEEQKVKVMKLEIENDKLENTSRAITASLEFIQQKLDEQTEMVTYLTFEKEDLVVEVERYKGDIKDLQNDVAVLNMQTTEATENPSHIPMATNQTPPLEVQNTPLRNIKISDTTPGTPLTPQACITAIGIVNDLMKRFGSIESKLSAIRNCNKATSAKKPKLDHSITEDCNGIGLTNGRPSRRWSSLFRYWFYSEDGQMTKMETAQP